MASLRARSRAFSVKRSWSFVGRLVEDPGQLPELVVAVHPDARPQVAPRELPRRRHDVLEGAGEGPGQESGQAGGDEKGEQEGDPHGPAEVAHALLHPGQGQGHSDDADGRPAWRTGTAT